MDKRVLLRGEGSLGETKIDQRANSPAFRIRRTCVIDRLDLDMTGFRECVCTEGTRTTKALILGCRIRQEIPTNCPSSNLAEGMPLHCFVADGFRASFDVMVRNYARSVHGLSAMF